MLKILGKVSDAIWATYLRIMAAILVGEAKRSFLAYMAYRRYWGYRYEESKRHLDLVEAIQREYIDRFMPSIILDPGASRDDFRRAEAATFERFVFMKRALYINSPEYMAAIATYREIRDSLDSITEMAHDH